MVGKDLTFENFPKSDSSRDWLLRTALLAYFQDRVASIGRAAPS